MNVQQNLKWTLWHVGSICFSLPSLSCLVWHVNSRSNAMLGRMQANGLVTQQMMAQAQQAAPTQAQANLIAVHQANLGMLQLQVWVILFVNLQPIPAGISENPMHVAMGVHAPTPISLPQPPSVALLAAQRLWMPTLSAKSSDVAGGSRAPQPLVWLHPPPW
jgi:hypothetical protein